jgi:hypothetical protein
MQAINHRSLKTSKKILCTIKLIAACAVLYWARAHFHQNFVHLRGLQQAKLRGYSGNATPAHQHAH